MGPGTSFGRCLSAGENGVFLGLEVEFGHFPGDTKRQPHVTVVVRFDGMGTVGTLGEAVENSLSGFWIEGGRVLLANVNHVSKAVVADLEIVERSLVVITQFPCSDFCLRYHPGRGGRRLIGWPRLHSLALVGVDDALDDGVLGVGVETAETIHAGDHGFPVHGLLRAAKTGGANLMAVAAHHFEIESVPGAVEF